MRRRLLVRRMRDEIRAGLRLSPVLLVALLLAALVWQVDTAALSGLFQSSPAETPPLVPTGSVSPGTPTALPPQTGTPSGPEPITSPSPPPVPTEAPIPTDLAVPEMPPEVTPGPRLPMITGGSEPTAAEGSGTPDDRQRYAQGDSNLRFDWGMLFDSVALLVSYIWLFCGILLFLAIPVLFVALWIASKRRQIRR